MLAEETLPQGWCSELSGAGRMRPDAKFRLQWCCWLLLGLWNGENGVLGGLRAGGIDAGVIGDGGASEPRGATILWLRPPCGSRNRLQVRLLVRSRWKIHRLAGLRVKPLPELFLEPC